MAKRQNRRAKAASPNAERRRHQKRIADAAAVIGLPIAQRVTGVLDLEAVPAIGTGPTPIRDTVRKLTRVELLRRSGTLDDRQAAACEWYAERAALAWDTTGCTASYAGRSGGGGAYAPDRLMARTAAIAHARDDHCAARALLPRAYAEIFDAVVCRNALLGPAAAAAFPDLKRSAAAARLVKVVAFCADLIAGRFGVAIGCGVEPPAAMTNDNAPGGMARQTRRLGVSAMADGAEAAAPWRLSDDMLRVIARAEERGRRVAGILIAETMLREVLRELGIGEQGEAELTLFGRAVEVRPQWRWGYVLVDRAAVAA